MNKKLLIVHPYDSSTRFLERIKVHLQGVLPDHTHYFSVKPNDASHNTCLAKVKNFDSGGLVLFMGHGRSDFLYGAKGDYVERHGDSDLKFELPEKFYKKERFIDETNIGVFNRKKVICLACNSNAKIANYAMTNGTITFVGFGDLPTSVEEMEAQGLKNQEGISLAIVEKAVKTEINFIIKRSIEIAIKKNYNFDSFGKLVKFVTQQRIADYLVNQRKVRVRKIIIDQLYKFKEEVRVFGNKYEKLIV